MKLSKSIFSSIFFVSIFSIILVSLFFIIFQFDNLKKEKIYIRKDFIETKKNLLKSEVSLVYDYIVYQEKRKRFELRKRLQQRVNQAYNIAKNIYLQNKGILDDEKIKYLIVQALKNISYEDDRQYFFINSNTGRGILFNKTSFLDVNKNVWDLQDIKGDYIIRKQSNIALTKGSGFVRNYFIKPDLEDNIQYPKLSFIKNFEEFNWHIGMGEYLDDFSYELKQDILSYIASIRFGKDGYIFVNRTDKKALVFDGAKLDKPKTYPNDTLFKMQLNAIKNENGDFFFYKFKKLNSKKEFPKLGYAKLYDSWGWIVGSGIYIDEIETQIEMKNIALKKIIKQELIFIAILIFSTLIVIYLLSKNITKKLTKNLELLTSSFNIASKNLSNVDSSNFSFEEFKNLSTSLNTILKERNYAERKQKEYLNIIDTHIITSSTNEKGIITKVSKAFCQISGYKKEELIGKSHSLIRHEDMPKEIYKQLWKTISSGKIWKGELKNKRKDGSFYWVDVIIEPIFQDKKIVGYTAIRHNITDKKRVEYLSITDELSTLYNRRYFNKKIDEEINRAKRENNYLSLMILDIDFFKKYNDTYGHMLGDNALRSVSKVLSNMTKRSNDFAFRLGGEEFGIIISSKDEEHPLLYADKIRQAIEELHIEHKNSEVSKHLTISIGIVIRKSLEIKDSNELYSLADKAVYLSKENGRNRVTRV